MRDIMTMTNAGGPNERSVNGNGSDEANNYDLNIESESFENFEEILMALTAFERDLSKASSMLSVTIPPELETYLKGVAMDGLAQFPWDKVKPLFRVKLAQVISEFDKRSPTAGIPPVPNVDPFNFNVTRAKVLDQLDVFKGIPFTIQRLAELITTPRKHYGRTDKFMRALEKNMFIVSTVEARCIERSDSPRPPRFDVSIYNIYQMEPHSPPLSEIMRSYDSDDEDEDENCICSDGMQNAEFSTPSSPGDSDEEEDIQPAKAADPGPKTEIEEVLKKDEPSTSENNSCELCNGISKKILIENDLASSSSDVSEKSDDVRTESVENKTSVQALTATDCEQQKPDECELNYSEEETIHGSSTLNSKSDEMRIKTQVDNLQPNPLTECTPSETKDNLPQDSTDADNSKEKLLSQVISGRSDSIVSLETSEAEKMDLDDEKTRKLT